MRKNVLVLLAILASVVLGGCAGPGELVRIPITGENGTRWTIVAHNQQVPDFMLSRDKLALNYLVKSDVDEKQLAAIAETERACRIFTKTSRPHKLVSVISSVGIYALAGYGGLYAGSQAIDVPNPSKYGGYGAWVSGTAGAANGIISLGGQTYTFESCGKELLRTVFPSAKVDVIQKSPY